VPAACHHSRCYIDSGSRSPIPNPAHGQSRLSIDSITAGSVSLCMEVSLWHYRAKAVRQSRKMSLPEIALGRGSNVLIGASWTAARWCVSGK
jgi:hypothetical protein